MPDPKNIYAIKGLDQVPRLLGFMDRNPYSKTYGCMDRSYWLDRSTDFSSAIFQFGVHSLALAHECGFKPNPFYKKQKVLEWCKAGIHFCWTIQKSDGSFDEFYPNEHGWAGPTGFLLYSILDSYSRLHRNFSPEETDSLLEGTRKAARYLARHDEVGVLSNHHMMALLPIYYSFVVTKDKKLLHNFQEKFETFLAFQDPEGWFLEYDGPDPGYLSATVSFLAKLFPLVKEKNIREKILKASQKAIEFSSFFVYPNRYYAGTIGSRQTLHFYPHGYEFFSDRFPLAGRIASFLREGLWNGTLVPPEIMADRYLAYRTSEMLISYENARESVGNPLLPFEQEPFSRFFPNCKILVFKKGTKYGVINLAKGGVVKIFDTATQKLEYNDCGIIGRLENGKTITSQWIDYERAIHWKSEKASVEGKMYFVDSPMPKPASFLALRAILLTAGQSTSLAYKIKGLIRKMIILKNKPSNSSFRREFDFSKGLEIKDSLMLGAQDSVASMQIGDEFSIRYVPQSLFFQKPELEIKGRKLNQKEIRELNQRKKLEIVQKIF